MKNYYKSPLIARLLIKLTTSDEDYEEFLLDLEESFVLISQTEQGVSAARWYWARVLESLPALMIDRLKWRMIMLKNYLKVALRNLRRNRVYSLINIIGLTVGLACALLILLWVQDEMSYNRFHENGDTIYRVVNRRTDRASTSSQAPAPLADVLLDEIPEIEEAIRFLFRGKVDVQHDGQFMGSWDGASADPEVFDVFSFPFLEGDARTALDEPQSVVVSESLAKACFGIEAPIGRLLEIKGDLLTVTGVLADIPGNSDIQFDFLRPHLSNVELVKYDRFIWNWFAFHLYVKVADGVDAVSIDEKIGDFLNTYRESSKGNLKVFLQPLARMHLWHLDGGGPIQYVIIFTVVALFVLALASINFINLSTAMAGRRAKEIGLRKVVGSSRAEIVRQFFGESVVIVALAGFSALLLSFLALPFFNTLSGKALTINLLNLNVSGLFLALLAGTALLAGLYPAIMLSALSPVKTLKGEKGVVSGKTGHRRFGMAGFLVVLQFTLSIGLMISTTVIHRQLQYMMNSDLGFNASNQTFVILPESVGRRMDALMALKQELIQSPHIAEVSGRGPTGRGGTVEWEGMTQDANTVEYLGNHVKYYFVDGDYLSTQGMNILEGRFFDEGMASDYQNAYVINEAAVKLWDLEEPVGMPFSLNRKAGTIIGVYQNMHQSGFKEEMGAEVLYMEPSTPWDNWAGLSVRFIDGSLKEGLADLKATWNRFYPGQPFNHQFVDDEIRQAYGMERHLTSLFNVFTGLALFISCLGLFSLISFMAERRRKEIGIRKTLGASVLQIWGLLSRKFTMWVVVSNGIAWPLAWFAMGRWLQNYPYQHGVEWWIFPVIGIAALVIALLTISVQSIKASVANPVKSLYYE
ncbi:ABC transporter permease [bacterium]|nr:ABC transporter permease [bacterium]